MANFIDLASVRLELTAQPLLADLWFRVENENALARSRQVCGIIDSMTPEERCDSKLLTDESRLKRIAAGAGISREVTSTLTVGRITNTLAQPHAAHLPGSLTFTLWGPDQHLFGKISVRLLKRSCTVGIPSTCSLLISNRSVRGLPALISVSRPVFLVSWDRKVENKDKALAVLLAVNRDLECLAMNPYRWRQRSRLPVLFNA